MKEQLMEAVEKVKNGEVILHLTDTIWGLACDPKNEAAVERIHQIKNRPEGKSFIVLISDPTQLYTFVEKIPEIAWDIIEMSEEPLTIVYPKGRNVAKKVLPEDGSIAIRLVKEGECFQLLKKMKNGLISSSANVSGDPRPSTFSEISEEVLNAVDYVVNSNLNTNKKASKIIKLDLDGSFKLIRG